MNPTALSASACTRRPAWHKLLLPFTVALCLTAACDQRAVGGGSLHATESSATVSTGFVVGDLGGMPVKIPRHLATSVEYNADPGWGESRNGRPPPRTLDSKLRSFGFDVRVPDMAGLSDGSLEADKRKHSIYNTMWIRVGLNTGENYPGDGSLDRRAKAMNYPEAKFQLEALPDSQDGLTVYSPSGTDPTTQKPNREHPDAKDLFVHRDASGHVDAYIKCSNRPHEAAPCTHDFSLGPNVKAVVYVGYRRGLLPQWQQIQTSLTELILSFKAP